MGTAPPHEDCWAKTTKDGRPGISVRDHCLNVGYVAEAMLAFLPRQRKDLLPVGSASLAGSDSFWFFPENALHQQPQEYAADGTHDSPAIMVRQLRVYCLRRKRRESNAESAEGEKENPECHPELHARLMSSKAAISSISQTWSDTPACIAGVTLRVL